MSAARALVVALLAGGVAAAGAGCHRSRSPALLPIGAACADDAACGHGSRFRCAGDHPGGYCEAQCGSDGDCPAGSVCVGGGPLSKGDCHRACASSADCRASEGYRCIRGESDADRDYCDPPGRSELKRRLRGGAWRW